MPKLTQATQLPARQWHDIHAKDVAIPGDSQWTHIQFRRYSGCAVCNLHLHSFLTRHQELQAAGIEEVVVFNSTRERIHADIPNSPFHLIADPHNQLYRDFGVQTSVLSVLNPAVWIPALRAVAQFGVQLARDKETNFGLPADFLIDRQGKLVAVHYGIHANDQWSLDELLNTVNKETAYA
jgi:peroxiredoxin